MSSLKARRVPQRKLDRKMMRREKMSSLKARRVPQRKLDRKMMMREKISKFASRARECAPSIWPVRRPAT
jgi:hypothetical protein